MVIKKSIKCKACGNYMSLYIQEKHSLKGKTSRCACGCEYECVQDYQGITKWRGLK